MLPVNVFLIHKRIITMRDFDLQPPIDAWSRDDDSIGEQTTNHFADDGEWITEIELDEETKC